MDKADSIVARARRLLLEKFGKTNEMEPCMYRNLSRLAMGVQDSEMESDDEALLCAQIESSRYRLNISGIWERWGGGGGGAENGGGGSAESVFKVFKRDR